MFPASFLIQAGKWQGWSYKQIIIGYFSRTNVIQFWRNWTQIEVPDRSDLRSDPSATHTVCFQTKITGSEIWFERTIVWSEVFSIWGRSDQSSLLSGTVWLETISVWTSTWEILITARGRSFNAYNIDQGRLLHKSSHFLHYPKKWTFWEKVHFLG